MSIIQRLTVLTLISPRISNEGKNMYMYKFCYAAELLCLQALIAFNAYSIARQEALFVISIFT